MRNAINTLCWLTFAFLLISVGSLPGFAQDEHTVLLYTFESGAGKVVKDLSEHKNDGELMGPKWGEGNPGGGLVFGGNGPRDFVEIPDRDSLDLIEGLTVEMWLYLEAWSTAGGTGATKETTYKVGPRSDKKVLIRMTTDKHAWGAAVAAGKTDMPLKKWTHIAGTYDAKSGDAKIYINGVLDGEGNIGGNITPNDDVLWLGRGAGPFLEGRMDEVRISNIARSEREIQELMNKGIEGVLAVKPQDKLATTWGKLKLNLPQYR
ncbi:MAG: LamG domain-containing protein [Candidatus Poribacteria bacterium]|nr:LamG domain-containing protein [Candidatus Poribacteria bacterium]